MTGPRSKACITCRERRVKCDEAEPTCSRCRRSNILCKGYRRALVVVDEAPRIMRDVTASANGQVVRQRRRIPPEARQEFCLWKDGKTHAENLSPTLLTPLNSDLYLGFLISRMNDGHGIVERDPWIRMRGDGSSICKLSADALATLFFGRAHSQQDIVLQGKKRYSSALQSLRRELACATYCSDAILATVAAMCFYELCAFTTRSAWRQHGHALSEMIKIRGPRSFQHPTARTIYQQSKILALSTALVCKEQTFFSEPEWKQIPWDRDPQNKTLSDYLYDILADVANLRVDAEALCFRKGVDQVETERTADHLKRLMTALDDWWEMWISANQQHCWEVPVDTATTVCLDRTGLLFDMSLEFDSFWTCFVWCSYMGGRLIVLDSYAKLARKYELEPFVVEQAPAISDVATLGRSNDSDSLVLSVLRCMDFLEKQSREHVGMLYVLWPMYVAAKSWDLPSREVQWMCDVCEKETEHFRGYVTYPDQRVSVNRYGTTQGWDLGMAATKCGKPRS